MLFDGVGIDVKMWLIKGRQNDYKGYSFSIEYIYLLIINTTLNIKDDYYEIPRDKISLKSMELKLLCNDKDIKYIAKLKEDKKKYE
ncbi:hypothetical protein BCR32DRAFT_280962 [Anaeromyces robustus]|uniref:Uncharacterized protein n=1 Tax=Anaeromyces robustus TaxID=1754192 RepID=A0A1Y1X2I2_9FUNG|nr:hypothetical protein BCR32DRAFT_280962 [Anaeromyces robustus]|eukprot:ORX79983.1 hypothetical protein BCR32DRAFT_280962 [Anaeromyces robustus]